MSPMAESYIQTMAGRETKRKKKKEQKKAEDGIVGRLAKNVLIERDKVSDVIKKRKKKKKGSSSSSYSDSSSDSDSDSDSSSESSSSSSDDTTKKPRKDKKKSSNDKTSVSAKSKSRKESKVQTLACDLASDLGETQKGMIEMATELRELRGFSAPIQKTFDQQLSEAKGANPAPKPLLALSQWKERQETNTKV